MLVAFGASAQTKKEKDVAAIKSMCGCHEVTFNFAETFVHTKDSLYEGSPNKVSGALEWVQLVEESDDVVVIQHLLLVGRPGNEQIIKHWRQDWLYENTEFYMYNGDDTWKPETVSKEDVAGQWTQVVAQVDDSPRYAGSASWVHVDGRSYWENQTDAPLPRREYTIRDDYNVMKRTNRHELTSEGWIHDQDNQKVQRAKDGTDVILAEEKGLNTYTRIDDSKCKAGQLWWEKNAQYWSDVRDVWGEVFGSGKELVINFEVDEKIMFNYLFELGDEAVEMKKYKSKEMKKRIRAVIQQHIASDIRIANNSN